MSLSLPAENGGGEVPKRDGRMESLHAGKVYVTLVEYESDIYVMDLEW